MNQQIEPVLEKFVNDDEIKEIAESTQIVQNSQQEQTKPVPVIEEQKQKILEKKKSPKNKTKETDFNDKMKEQGKLNVKNRKGSSYFSPSLAFLKPFDVIEETNKKPKEEQKSKVEDLSLGKNIISKEETSDLENIQSIYGFNQNEETDPVKMSLKNRLEELERKKEEIIRQHSLDKEIYLKKYRSVTNLFINGSNIVILVYAINSKQSFEGLEYWYNTIKEKLEGDNYILAVVGSKIDLIDNEVVQEEEAKKFANSKNALFKLVSSKQDPEGIEKLFKLLLEELIKEKKYDVRGESIAISRPSKLKKQKKACC